MKKSVTLVEMLVSVAIIGIIVAGAFGGIKGCSTGSVNTGESTVAEMEQTEVNHPEVG